MARHNDGTAAPVHQLEGHEHVPRLPLRGGVCEAPECNELVAERGGDGGRREKPPAEVQQAGVEAEDAAIAGAASGGGDVVDAAGGRDGRD